MRTVLVTGSDTGVGKTRVAAALARLFAVDGARVQIVKVVETGRLPSTPGDADYARTMSGGTATAVTLATFAAPLAPAAAARAEGRTISVRDLVRGVQALPRCDWRLVEGAGGIASPIDDEGADWADFALAAGIETIVVVVPDRLGAINQARLAHARAVQSALRAGVWLNAIAPVDPAVAASTREGLLAARVPIWAEQSVDAAGPSDPKKTRALIEGEGEAVSGSPANACESLSRRCQRVLREREQRELRRNVRVSRTKPSELNLADNDYLALAHDPELAAAAARAAEEHGTSASASPLITGWLAPHEKLVDALGAWHGFSSGLLWSSGYAANSAILSVLPQKGDLVLADRLIHHSMIAGLLRSGARLARYEHLDLDRLEEALEREGARMRTTFVVTESLFSMDGDYPDFRRLAALKERFGFCLIVDEAHAVGWYGPEGAGLTRALEAEAAVDVLVGTLGKTLASGGAYTLFRDEAVRDFVVNHAGEFIYSTALSPLNAAVAIAAVARVRALSSEQKKWQERSREFRAQLRAAGWDAAAGDSPIVPVGLPSASAAVAAAAALRTRGIIAAAIRPPTVPAGTSRLRFSLKRTFDRAAAEQVIGALAEWRSSK